MTDEGANLEGRINQLEHALATLNRRVRQLESRQRGGRDAAESEELENVLTAADARPAAAPPSDTSVVLTLVGRTFMVFGGAFLLRALTDSGQLPRGLGIAIGLAYAAIWFGRAGLVRPGERQLGSILHGISGVAIGYPLLWEATTKFGFLSPPASAVALGALTGLAFAVAWYRRMEVLAALALIGAIATSFGLLKVTAQFVPFSLLLTMIGVAALWLGYDRDWFWLRWPAALFADAAVTALALPGITPASIEQPAAVIGVQLFLLTTYAGSVAVRTLLRRRVVVPFEVVQTLAALGVGLVGAVVVARANATGELGLGLASVILGIGGYAAAVTCWRSRHDIGANFYFYAALGLILTLTGWVALLHGNALAIVLALSAVLTAWLAIRHQQPTFVFASAAYCVAAAGASGLLNTIVQGFVLSPSAESAPGIGGWITLAATAMCLALRRAESEHVPAPVAALPRVLVALLLSMEIGATIIVYLAGSIAGDPPVAGIVATLRTAVLAAIAVILAAATRSPRAAELGWLLYPVLGIAGFKLLAEDFRYSEPGTLFLALGLFGAALVATARLVRHKHGDSTAESGEQGGVGE